MCSLDPRKDMSQVTELENWSFLDRQVPLSFVLAVDATPASHDYTSFDPAHQPHITIITRTFVPSRSRLPSWMVSGLA